MTRHATISGEVRRKACAKLRSLGYKADPKITVRDVCEIIKSHTGEDFSHDMVSYMSRFANQSTSIRATSPDWDCIRRPEYKMKGAMAIAAQRARESL